MSTRVALDMPDRTFVGQVVATETPAPDRQETSEEDGSFFSRVTRNWPQGWWWALVVIALALIAHIHHHTT